MILHAIFTKIDNYSEMRGMTRLFNYWLIYLTFLQPQWEFLLNVLMYIMLL